MELGDKVLKGHIRSIGKAISCIENNRPEKEQLIDYLYPFCGKAEVIGVTGSPGAGKSTLVDKLIKRERKLGKKVGIIAVDPSSPFSGGAILGDRLRMQNHASDDDVYIRSMASRGHLGGIATATADAIKIFDAAGFDLIIIETIGVGQTEIEVMDLADLVLLVLVPGMGDEIQALKAGIMEIGDIYVINKKDHDGAQKLYAEVEYVLNINQSENDKEKNPIILTSANLDEGIDDLVKCYRDYFKYIRCNNILEEKRKKRIVNEINHIFTEKIISEVNQFLHIEKKINQWVKNILHEKVGPYTLINKKIEQFIKEFKEQ